MPISWTCSCGRTLRVADEHAGKSARCPKCGCVATAPKPEFALEVVDEGAEFLDDSQDQSKPERKSSGKTAGKPRVVAESSRTNRIAEKQRPWQSDSDDEEEDVDRRKKRKSSSRKEEQHRGFEHKVLNGGVVGGMLAMVVAVVWFVLGLLLADILFFYPPILFIIGLVAVLKGLFANSDE